MSRLTRIGWAWEFLRRNSQYQEQWNRDGANPNDWGLQHFEDPARDARRATVFWRPQACAAVLPVLALPPNSGEQCLRMSKLKCLTTVVPGADGQSVDVLFHRDCRFLQVAIMGTDPIKKAQLFARVVPMPKQSAARVLALRRFANLVTSCALQASLYPPDRRAQRLSQIVQALDGWRAGVAYREIAVAIHGERRVEEQWNNPGEHLRDQVRRAVSYGRKLVSGGYRQFLR